MDPSFIQRVRNDMVNQNSERISDIEEHDSGGALWERRKSAERSRVLPSTKVQSPLFKDQVEVAFEKL